jgi:hypothetical protein
MSKFEAPFWESVCDTSMSIEAYYLKRLMCAFYEAELWTSSMHYCRTDWKQHIEMMCLTGHQDGNSLKYAQKADRNV